MERRTMKIRGANKTEQALTLRELMIVIVVVGIMFLLLVPDNRSHALAKRINCASNLKQVGLAFKNLGRRQQRPFPMQALTNELGAPLYTDLANAFRYFQVMSNELSNPKILFCPAEIKRLPAANFTSDFNSRGRPAHFHRLWTRTKPTQILSSRVTAISPTERSSRTASRNSPLINPPAGIK